MKSKAFIFLAGALTGCFVVLFLAGSVDFPSVLNVILQSDEVGLVKKEQLPSALQNGNLKVAVQEASQLPEALTKEGNLKIALGESNVVLQTHSLDKPVSVFQRFVAPQVASNVTLDTQGKPFCSFWAKTIQPEARVFIYATTDPDVFRNPNAEGESQFWHRIGVMQARNSEASLQMTVGYRYLKLESPETGSAIAFLEISCTR